MDNKPALKLRYFEDFEPDEAFEFGEIRVSEKEIIKFAKDYDPQAFHIDPIAAKDSIYGGIIASGWHTGSMLMRCLVDNFVSIHSMGSPGIENLRWPHPVRGGDILRAKVTITSARRSRSKPDRGILVNRAELFNQNDILVMEMTSSSFILCRDDA